MLKKIIITAICVVLIYIGVCFVGLELASKQLHLTPASNLSGSERIDDLFARVKKIRALTYPLRPIAYCNSSWRNLLKALDASVRDKDLFEELAGKGQERTFLVVLQNNTELRPSGGFWGAYGILKVKDGAITSFETFSTNELDKQNQGKFTSPEEITDIIGTEWRFWNANWSPDFKKSIEQGLFFYKQVDPNVNFDGAFGPNVDFLLALLKISGPVSVPGYDFTVDENNFIQKMIYEPIAPAVIDSAKSYRDIIDPHEKKYLLADLGTAIADQIIGQGKVIELAKQSLESLSSQNLIIYIQKPELEQKLEELGWAGHVNHSGNFAMVVDANFGSKLDLFVQKKITLDQIDKRKYKLTLSYKNTFDGMDKTLMFFNYRDLVRVFVPTGSKQIAQTGGQMASRLKRDKDTGLDYMYSMFILKPNESRTISFTWEVPESLSGKKIKIQKQPGQHADIVENLHIY